MADFGRILVFLGVALLIVGGTLIVAQRIFPMLGNLPGDFRFEGERSSFYFPLVSMLIISLIGTVILNIILRLFK